VYIASGTVFESTTTIKEQPKLTDNQSPKGMEKGWGRLNQWN